MQATKETDKQLLNEYDKWTRVKRKAVKEYDDLKGQVLSLLKNRSVEEMETDRIRVLRVRQDAEHLDEEALEMFLEQHGKTLDDFRYVEEDAKDYVMPYPKTDLDLNVKVP